MIATQRYPVKVLRRAVIATLVVMWFCMAPAALTGARADDAPHERSSLVIINAKLWTGISANAASRRDDATLHDVFVEGDRIVAITKSKANSPPGSASITVIDAGGRRVIPGITDSHTHVISGGFQLRRLYLRDVADRSEFVAAIAKAARNRKKGDWVLGGRWSVESWADPTPPNRHWIDSVTGEVPVMLTRMDGHQALVNSAALSIAGIDAAGPPDPVGGQVQRDPKTGEPTGVLKESAMALVRRFIPEPSPEDRYEALIRAMTHANSLGVTSVHDMSAPDDLDAFLRAHREGRLTVRITSYVSVSDWANWYDKVEQFSVRDDMLTVAGLKGYMDGSLGSRTAYMREPYSDSGPDTKYPRGQLTAMAVDRAAFREMVRGADARRLQLAVHAIGDEANHLLLDAYEFARQRNGDGTGNGGNGADGRLPHRIEHAQHLQLTDIERLARLGVVASMQPYHKADDGRYAEQAIGSARLRGSYAFRKLIDAGVLLCFGSDWPVVTLNPLAGMDAAVNAKTIAGNTWLPSHSLTLDEALYAYTAAPAHVAGKGDRLGTIAKGMLADMVVLEQDPFAKATTISAVKVRQTIVGGKIVFDASAQAR